jgi:hypothetical protein
MYNFILFDIDKKTDENYFIEGEISKREKENSFKNNKIEQEEIIDKTKSIYKNNNNNRNNNYDNNTNNSLYSSLNSKDEEIKDNIKLENNTKEFCCSENKKCIIF